MATAKNPGVGQGRGGGRPQRGPVARMRLDLSPEAASILEAHAEAAGLPVWRVVDDLIRVALAGQVPPAPRPQMPAVVLEMAREACAFLEAQEDPRAAARALRRAWGQALLLASHGINQRAKGPASEEK